MPDDRAYKNGKASDTKSNSKLLDTIVGVVTGESGLAGKAKRDIASRTKNVDKRIKQAGG